MPNDTTPPPEGDVQALIVECRDLAMERGEKAAEQFMIAGILRDQDRDPSGFLMAGEQAARTQKALTEAAAALERLAEERDTLEMERDTLDLHAGELQHATENLDLELDGVRQELATERAARERAEAMLREIAVPPLGGNWGAEGHASCVEIARAALQPQPQPQGGE